MRLESMRLKVQVLSSPIHRLSLRFIPRPVFLLNQTFNHFATWLHASFAEIAYLPTLFLREFDLGRFFFSDNILSCKRIYM